MVALGVLAGCGVVTSAQDIGFDFLPLFRPFERRLQIAKSVFAATHPEVTPTFHGANAATSLCMAVVGN